MSRNKKPVILVALLLSALILLPALFWIALKVVGSGDAIQPGDASRSPVELSPAQAVDFDLSQLAEAVEKLLAEDMADALRKGDVSLDYVADLKAEAEKAAKAMSSGKLRQAKERYTSVLAAAEGRLADIAAANKARDLKESISGELQRLGFLRSAFEATYSEAVASYNSALSALEAGDFDSAMAAFGTAAGVLGELEAAYTRQVADLLEAGNLALQEYDLIPARQAFQSVLAIDPAQPAATEGLARVSSLEDIADSVEVIRTLEAEGQLEAALAALDQILAQHPDNLFLQNQRLSLEQRIRQRNFDAFVAASIEAEEAGDTTRAIAELEAALKLRTDAAQQARLAALKEKKKLEELELLLAEAFQSLKEGHYQVARDLYQKATEIDPNSKEARTGLEKASSLYLAGIRYSQNVASAQRHIEEGRFPLAAKLFNQAMSSRPAKLAPAKVKEEEAIRAVLEAQSREVPIVVQSDGRTFVSIIGVLPPERFRSMDLKLFPDVYKVRGTRKGYKTVEMDLKVDATRGAATIKVECTEKI